MTIEVLFFAQLKDAFGCERKKLSLEDRATVNDAIEALKGSPEWDQVRMLPMLCAVNERMVSADHRLQDGDRLALLTPISGG